MSNSNLRAALSEIVKRGGHEDPLPELMLHLLPAIEFVEITLAENLKIDRGKIRHEERRLHNAIRRASPELVSHVTGRTKAEVLEGFRRSIAPRYESQTHLHKLVARYIVPVLVNHGHMKAVDTAGAPILAALDAVYKHTGIPVAAGLENPSVRSRTTLEKYRSHLKSPLTQ